VTTGLPAFTERPLPGPSQSQGRRRTALDELRAAGWPQRRRERWRYTDLEPLASADFDVLPESAGETDLAAAMPLLDALAAGAPRLVFVDGRLNRGLSSATPSGVETLDLDAEWREFDSRWADDIAATDYPLAALNTAFNQRGLWLRVAAGSAPEQPLHLIQLSSGLPQIAAQARIVIEIGAGARVTLIEHIVDSGAATGWLNTVTQVRQAQDSTLDLYRVQRHGMQQVHTSLLAADLAANANLRAGYVDVGGRLVRNDIHVNLRERAARVELFGLFVAGKGQHLDNHTTIVHAAPETLSDEAFRGIIGERGRGVFNGKVVVRPGAQRIDARQSNDNLLLGVNAEIDTKPELEIYANDVKCSHGSTVGELDADQLFYLRARGVNAADARRILTAAFASSLLERVRNDALRTHLVEAVTTRLGDIGEEQP
jgi:Fe-S cluster assembly protein SufD